MNRPNATRAWTWAATTVWMILAGIAVAQPVQGRDLTLTATGGAPGVYYMDKTQPTIGTILSVTGSLPNWVEMWGDNVDLAVCLDRGTGTSPSGFLRVTPNGLVSSISGRITGAPNHAYLDEDGDSFLVSATVFNLVYDVPNGGGGFTTLILVNAGLSNAMCVDPDTGDVIVGGSTDYPPAPFPPTPGTGWLLRYDRNSKALLQSITTGILRVSGVYPDYEQGGFFVSRFDQGAILRVDNAGGVSTVLANNVNGNSVRVDDDGTLWMVDVADVTNFDRQGNIIRKITVPLPTVGLTGLGIYGNRRLVANGVAKAGSTLTLDVRTNLANEVGKAYALAASFATRPGFRVAGKFMALAVDNLFVTTSQNQLPGVFQGFRGTIDQLGRAQAAIAVPNGFPANTGIRVHVQGVILDPAGPAGIATTTNPVHFSLR